MTYPLTLDVRARRVLVVGGGSVAARRAAALVDAGAWVDVVAPDVVEDIADLAREGRLRWHPREYAPDDLEGAWLVHTATGDPAVDAAVGAEAADRRMWCVVASDAGQGSATTPAAARSGDVTVAVSTATRDPGTAKAVRDAVALLLDTESLPLRRRRAGGGSVALVGGGPGDPGLLTVRARQLLSAADVVVVDRLGPRELLDRLPDDVEVVDAGKAPHAHNLTQEQINELLVERANAGQRVVRLKGGDPFVLGRGGEELAACLAAGVAVEVVPGVSSAVAVPAYAGIPVTHRGVAASFAVVSAHREPGADDVDWAALATGPDTLVLLMAVGRLAEVSAALVAGGRPATTPAAVVSDGTTPRQRTLLATLGTIAEAAAEAELAAPAVVVVGAVAALARDLDWWRWRS